MKREEMLLEVLESKSAKEAQRLLKKHGIVLPPLSKIRVEKVKAKIRFALASLSSREAKVIALRYGLEDGYGYTPEEIGRKIGVRRETVLRIEKTAIVKLESFR